MQRGFDRWGVKEVRWDVEMASYLRWLFPDARFVFLVRNPFDAYRSYRQWDWYDNWPFHTWYDRWPSEPIDSPESFGSHWRRLAGGFLGRPLGSRARLIVRTALPRGLAKGHWFAPVAFEIGDDDIPQREVFGPVLHVLRYPADGLDEALDRVAATGYGLTLGIHSRINSTIRRIQAAMPVGNVYVNRDMVGAVVGVHPFGGEGLSGTGPKAGGPHYLHRFAVERTVSENTVAMGGNASLLSLTDDAA